MKCHDEFVTYTSAELRGMYIHIPKRIISLLSKYMQGGSMNEAGGMLFGSLRNNSLYILTATEPSHEDKFHRFSISMNKEKMQKRIDDMHYNHKQHYVGDWHTHPEHKPSPSPQDLLTAKGFLSNQDALNYFAMIIVSCISFSESYIGLCDRSKEYIFHVQE